MKNVIVKKSKINAFGVFANKNFEKGHTVLVIDDSYIVSNSSNLTSDEFENHCDYFDNKIVLMQPPEVYINHSCNPNTYIQTISDIRYVVAMKNIKKGKEITYDYAINGENEGTFSCKCGAKNCRKIFNGNYFKLPLKIQKQYYKYLDIWFKKKYKNKLEAIRN